MKKPEPTRKARGNNSTRMTPTAICPPLPVNRSAEVALVSYRNYAGDITYHVQLMRSGCSSPGETLVVSFVLNAHSTFPEQLVACWSTRTTQLVACYSISTKMSVSFRNAYGFTFEATHPRKGSIARHPGN